MEENKVEITESDQMESTITTHQVPKRRQKGGIITMPFIIGKHVLCNMQTLKTLFSFRMWTGFTRFYWFFRSLYMFFILHCSKWVFWESGKLWANSKHDSIFDDTVQPGINQREQHPLFMGSCLKFHAYLGGFPLGFLSGSLPHHWLGFHSQRAGIFIFHFIYFFFWGIALIFQIQ